MENKYAFIDFAKVRKLIQDVANPELGERYGLELIRAYVDYTCHEFDTSSDSIYCDGKDCDKDRDYVILPTSVVLNLSFDDFTCMAGYYDLDDTTIKFPLMVYQKVQEILIRNRPAKAAGLDQMSKWVGDAVKAQIRRRLERHLQVVCRMLSHVDSRIYAEPSAQVLSALAARTVSDLDSLAIQAATKSFG